MQLLNRRSQLMSRTADRRARLKESYRLQQFDRDCDEMLGWVNEKLKTASDQSYLDPTNIRGKLQKHNNFEQELRANRNRLDEIKGTAQELIDADHYAKDHVQVSALKNWKSKLYRKFYYLILFKIYLDLNVISSEPNW